MGLFNSNTHFCVKINLYNIKHCFLLLKVSNSGKKNSDGNQCQSYEKSFFSCLFESVPSETLIREERAAVGKKFLERP